MALGRQRYVRAAHLFREGDCPTGPRNAEFYEPSLVSGHQVLPSRSSNRGRPSQRRRLIDKALVAEIEIRLAGSDRNMDTSCQWQGWTELAHRLLERRVLLCRCDLDDLSHRCPTRG
ncbi:hypothetical protein ACP4OV_026983 [Aristida adscensionis]